MTNNAKESQYQGNIIEGTKAQNRIPKIFNGDGAWWYGDVRSFKVIEGEEMKKAKIKEIPLEEEPWELPIPYEPIPQPLPWEPCPQIPPYKPPYRPYQKPHYYTWTSDNTTVIKTPWSTTITSAAAAADNDCSTYGTTTYLGGMY